MERVQLLMQRHMKILYSQLSRAGVRQNDPEYLAWLHFAEERYVHYYKKRPKGMTAKLFNRGVGQLLYFDLQNMRRKQRMLARLEQPVDMSAGVGVSATTTMDITEVEVAEIVAAMAVNLTDRERRILQMRQMGMTNRQIGVELGLSGQRISQIRGRIKEVYREVLDR